MVRYTHFRDDRENVDVAAPRAAAPVGGDEPHDQAHRAGDGGGRDRRVGEEPGDAHQQRRGV